MGFPTPISAPNATRLRTSAWWQRVLVAVNPGETVFAARANQNISNAPFIQFAYDTVTTGSYADVWAGMVVYISATNDIRAAKYRGRVRLAPTTTTFYIDENATLLNDGDYIFVVRDVDLFARVRRDTLKDGSIPYHNLEPMIENLPSVLVLYDDDGNGTVSYTSVQTGIAVASGASIVSWAWAASGAGAVTFSNPSVINPTITFDVGHHYLLRVVVVDSNNVPHTQFVQVYAVPRDLSAPVIAPIVTGNISHSQTDGFNASVTAYADVGDLLDRSHAVIFNIQRFGDNTSAPVFTNVLMNGRFRSEEVVTTGTEDAGGVPQVTFPIEGMTGYLQRLRVPDDIVRADTTPTAWGEINAPNPFRMAVYVMTLYTTLTNLCSFSAGSALFAAWRPDGKGRGTGGGYALEVLNNILEPIKAAANFAPDGAIYLEQNASYQVNRSSIQTIYDFSNASGDYREYAINRDSSRTIAQVTAWGGVLNTSTNTVTTYTSLAPSVVYGDGGETLELTRELLTANSTPTAAITELASRAGNEYAYRNPKDLLRAVLWDAYAGILIATNYQRWTHTIPAAGNSRELAYTTANKWQLQSVDLQINADGSCETTAEFIEETEFTDAQAIASQLPDNLSNLPPILPELSNYPAFPNDPLWMYPTDTPAVEELQPTGAYSGYLAYGGMTADQAAQAAAQQGAPGCTPLQINLRDPGSVTTPFSSVLNDPYTVKVWGFGTVGTGGGAPVTDTYDFTTSSGGWQSGTRDAFFNAVYIGGVGWRHLATDTNLTTDISFEIWHAMTPGDVVTGVEVDYILSAAGDTSNAIGFTDADQGAAGVSITTGTASAGTHTFSASGLSYTLTQDGVYIQFNIFHVTSGDSLIVTGIRITRTTPETLNGDAFYEWVDGEAANAYGATRGFRIDNAAPTTPAYSDDHSYILPFTGTGNPVAFNFDDPSYSDNSNSILNVWFCTVDT